MTMVNMDWDGLIWIFSWIGMDGMDHVINGVFHELGIPKMVGLFHGKSPSIMDEELGYLHFRKPPNND